MQAEGSVCYTLQYAIGPTFKMLPVTYADLEPRYLMDQNAHFCENDHLLRSY